MLKRPSYYLVYEICWTDRYSTSHVHTDTSFALGVSQRVFLMNFKWRCPILVKTVRTDPPTLEWCTEEPPVSSVSETASYHKTKTDFRGTRLHDPRFKIPTHSMWAGQYGVIDMLSTTEEPLYYRICAHEGVGDCYVPQANTGSTGQSSMCLDSSLLNLAYFNTFVWRKHCLHQPHHSVQVVAWNLTSTGKHVWLSIGAPEMYHPGNTYLTNHL